MTESQPVRPGTVTAAGLVALVASLVVLTWLAVSLGLLMTGRAELPDGMRAQRAYPALAVGLAWSALAILLAVLTLRGSNAGRIGLAVSAALAGSLSLTASVFLAGAVLTLVACMATLILLFTASARHWFRAQRAARD